MSSDVIVAVYCGPQVNDCKMTGKTQAEAVNILRSTRGLVKLWIQREETFQSPRPPSVEV